VLGSGTQDIYVSRQDSSGGFGARSVVTSLSSAADDVMPNVRKDGLEVVFASTRPGGKGMFDIWSATRPDTRSAWSTPTNVAVVNTAGSDTRPSLSWDGTRLYLGSSGDIYLSHR
jgi:Tol biopolymer transport system component